MNRSAFSNLFHQSNQYSGYQSAFHQNSNNQNNSNMASDPRNYMADISMDYEVEYFYFYL